MPVEKKKFFVNCYKRLQLYLLHLHFDAVQKPFVARRKDILTHERIIPLFSFFVIRSCPILTNDRTTGFSIGATQRCTIIRPYSGSQGAKLRDQYASPHHDTNRNRVYYKKKRYVIIGISLRDKTVLNSNAS